VDNIGHGVKW